MAHSINWFEIPVKNFDRAKAFYETVFDSDMGEFEAMGMKSAFFPADMQNGDVSGCLIQSEGYEPSTTGSLIYLNGGNDLSTPLSKVENAGGKVLLPKTSIGAHGFMAHFADTEGNKIGLHSRS
ncbi:MAG: VOC family protein [Ignavibacteriae bacterium]|nr:VOC family protein [Ignavibacteriota bacterium]